MGEVVSQTRRMSIAESLLNVSIGYGVALGAQVAIFPLFGIHIPFHSNLLIGAAFTVVSIVRSYFVRRLFNWLHVRQPRTSDPAAPADASGRGSS